MKLFELGENGNGYDCRLISKRMCNQPHSSKFSGHKDESSCREGIYSSGHYASSLNDHDYTEIDNLDTSGAGE